MDGYTSHITPDNIEFCLQNDIELMCIPPHTSHRLQPLDTHINKSLKSLWSEQVHQYLRSSDHAILTRFDFHLPFSTTWKEISEKRGLIVDSFRHCGLFPLRNTVAESEYCKSKCFEMKSRPLDCDLDSHTLKNTFQSPQKQKNPCHDREHDAHATSPNY